MTVSSKGTYGEPVVTDPPTTIADFAAHAAYSHLVGNCIVDTAANRSGFSAHFGFAPYLGLEYFETDTKNRYIYIESGWAGISTDASIVAFNTATFDFTSASGGGFEATRVVNFRNATRFTAAPIVALGVFTGAANDQHAGVQNVTATGFTLYYWRANQTSTSIGWTATPNQL